MHLWRYIGHIMGVQPRYFPQTVREGIQLSAMYMLKRAYQASDDGRELVESHPRAFKPQSGTPCATGSATRSTTAPSPATRASSCRAGSIAATTCPSRGLGRSTR